MTAPEVRQRGLLDWAALRTDLRAAGPDAAAALVITVAIFFWLYVRIRTGSSQTLDVMPMMADADAYWAYWLCQAFGWSGLLWAWITVVLGLVRSSTHPRWLLVSTVRLERWHRTTSLTTIGLMFAHAFMFFVHELGADDEVTGPGSRVWTAFVGTFVPGGYGSGTGVIAILIGLIAFYLAIPLGLAYYVRHRSGTRVWQVLHRFIIVVYVLSVWHTLLYGTNVWYTGPFRTTIWLLQVPVAVLLLARLFAPARRGDRLRLRDARGAGSPIGVVARVLGRVLAAAGAVVLVVVPITGHDGGRTHGAESAPLNVTPTMVWVGLAVFVLALPVTVAQVRRRSRRRSSDVRAVDPR